MKTIRLLRVEFEHATSTIQKEYERIFGCCVYFKQPRNALVMDFKCLNFPILEPNSNLLKIFETYANDRLKSANSSDTFTQKTTRLLINMMPGSLPNINVIAKKDGVETG